MIHRKERGEVETEAAILVGGGDITNPKRRVGKAVCDRRLLCCRTGRSDESCIFQFCNDFPACPAEANDAVLQWRASVQRTTFRRCANTSFDLSDVKITGGNTLSVGLRNCQDDLAIFLGGYNR